MGKSKKTFIDNLTAADNPALAFIGGDADTPQEPPKTEAPRTIPLERYDFHKASEKRQRELADLREQAQELSEQARELKRMANHAKIAAIKAANLEARRTLTTKFRNTPDYANPRTKRVNLLIRPDLFTLARNFCEESRISMNHLMEVAVEEFIKQQRAAAEAEGDK